MTKTKTENAPLVRLWSLVAFSVIVVVAVMVSPGVSAVDYSPDILIPAPNGISKYDLTKAELCKEEIPAYMKLVSSLRIEVPENLDL